MIAPLNDSHALAEWGRCCDNCCGSLWRKVLYGKLFLYAVSMPSGVLATASLRKTSGGWALGDLKEARNREPRLELKQVVREWINHVFGGGKREGRTDEHDDAPGIGQLPGTRSQATCSAKASDATNRSTC